MNDKELFEIRDDLPDVIKDQLLKTQERTNKIVELLKIKSPLNYDQIIVGMFRRFNKPVTRTWVNSNCYNLVRAGLIVRTSMGEYRLPSRADGPIPK